jgi:hypothetical protein
MSTSRFPIFLSEMNRAGDLVGLGQSLGVMTHGRVDSSDLFRAALVQAVSALDSYVHGVVLDRAVDIMLGRASHVAGNVKIGLPFGAVRDVVTAQTVIDRELAARTHLAQRLSLETFQRPDDIAKAFAMVGLPKLWSTVWPTSSADAQKAIALVVQRRNRIVHQCDSDPLNPGSVTPLTDSDTLDSIKVVRGSVAAIDQIC